MATGSGLARGLCRLVGPGGGRRGRLAGLRATGTTRRTAGLSAGRVNVQRGVQRRTGDSLDEI